MGKHTADGTHWSGWTSLGGRVSGSIGQAAPANGAAGIVYARSSGNALRFNEFAGTTAGVTRGWHSLGGRVTSGVSAVFATANGTTWAVALGADGHIWANSGVWPAHKRSKVL